MSFLLASLSTNRIRNERKGIFWSRANSIRLAYINAYKWKGNGSDGQFLSHTRIVNEDVIDG
jgi:hypothetical protein